MSRRLRITGLLMAGALCLPVVALADTQTTHHAHTKKKEATPPPPLPSGTQGPVPQVPLDSLPAVAPQVTFEDGMLTIVAPNSTLGDILRSVKKRTSAEIEVPAAASERVVTRLGPAPAREVMAELLNGSRYNYILLGSPEDSNALTKVVLVAKTGPDTVPNPAAPAEGAPNPNPNAGGGPPGGQPPAEAQEVETPDDTPEDNSAEQNSAETEQPAPDQPGVKTPQQLLQEMQQRQMLMQQQGQQPQGLPGSPAGVPIPHQPQPPQQPQDQ
jgi:hypothetical protein